MNAFISMGASVVAGRVDALLGNVRHVVGDEQA